MSKRRRTTLRLLSTLPRARPARVPPRPAAVLPSGLLQRHLDTLHILMHDNQDLALAIMTATERWARGQRVLQAHGNKMFGLVMMTLALASC